MDPKGKVAVVTGAASGIGRASATALAAAGASVVVADVDEVGGEDTVRLIAQAGGTAVFHRTDVRRLDDIEDMFRRAVEEFGGVDIVHNNAGIVAGNPPWPDTPIQRVQDMLAINLGGVTLGTRVALEHLRRRGGGVVVNTSSIASLSPMPDDAMYAATKAGVTMFTKSCAALAEREGIRVNAVLPGLVDTPIINKTGDGTQPAEWLKSSLAIAEALSPDDIAAVVLELVRDDALAGETRVVMNELHVPGDRD